MKKILKVIAVSALTLTLAAGGVCTYGVMHYIRHTPVITPHENVVTLPETVLSIDTLADVIQYEEKRIAGASWSDGSADELYIRDNGQSLSVGDRTGTVQVVITAVGTVAEHRDAVVTVEVRADS